MLQGGKQCFHSAGLTLKMLCGGQREKGEGVKKYKLVVTK